MTEIATAIANWLEVDGHDRPFFRDPNFVSAFGRPGPALLRAAVDELKQRAAAKAQAAGMPASWNANLPDNHFKGLEPQERN